MNPFQSIPDTIKALLDSQAARVLVGVVIGVGSSLIVQWLSASERKQYFKILSDQIDALNKQADQKEARLETLHQLLFKQSQASLVKTEVKESDTRPRAATPVDNDAVGEKGKTAKNSKRTEAK